MERIYEVTVYRVELICDACGQGLMKPTGTMIGGWPPKFPHQCTECLATNNYLLEQYPKTVYKEITSTPKEFKS